MQNSGRVRIASVLSLFLSFFTFHSFVLAADVDNTIQSTGPSSETFVDVTTDNDYEVDAAQATEITNSLNFKLNTGNNKIKKVTSFEGLTTGDIDAKVTLVNEANTSIPLQIDAKSADDSIDATISKTGPNSTTSITTENNRNIRFNLNKSAEIDNDIEVSAETGGNTIAYVTKAGVLKTGNIDLDFELINKANAQEKDKDLDCIECKKNETPIPTPNASPTPQPGNGGAETPTGGIVPAGFNLLPVLILMLILAALSLAALHVTDNRQSKNI